MDLIGPASVIFEDVDHEGDVGCPGEIHRLTGIQSFQLNQLLFVLLEQVNKLEHEIASISWCNSSPWAIVESRSCRSNGNIHVSRFSHLDLSNNLFSRGIDGVESLAANGIYELTVNKQLGVYLLNR